MNDELDDESRRPRDLKLCEVTVSGLRESTDSRDPEGPALDYVVELRDTKGRVLPVHIGAFETMAIQAALKAEAPERPLTHDLLRNLLERLGGTLERVVIDDLWNATFYARIFLTQKNNNTELELDSRPSDAIALSLRTRAPIYVAEAVLAEASKDTDEPRQ
jgi:uncharacterized protein